MMVKARASFVPQLAAEMPTVSEDEPVYTFKIRPDVKFHNGDVLTPTDVAYSFSARSAAGRHVFPAIITCGALPCVGMDDISLLVDPEGGLYDDRAGIIAADPAVVKAACETVQAAIVPWTMPLAPLL